MADLPEVNLCLAVTLDGRIADKPAGAPDFTSRYDREKLFSLRAEHDVLLVGAATVRQEQLPPLVRNDELVAERVAAGKPAHPAVAIVSASLELPWTSGFFRSGQRFFVVTARVPKAQRAAATAAGVELFETGDQLSLESGLRKIKSLGFSRVLAEGGGRLVHSLIDASLVRHLHLTLAPTLIAGADTPSLCRGPVLQPRPAFTLQNCTRHGDELHLVYAAGKAARC